MGFTTTSSTFVVQNEAGTIARNVRVPDTAIAVIGVTWIPGAFTRHVQIELVSSEGTRVCGFLGFRGRKTSSGTFPISGPGGAGTGLVLNVQAATADSAVTFSVIVHFLVTIGQPPYSQPYSQSGVVVYPWFPHVSAVPFKATGGDDAVVNVAATSAATTAQTVDIGTIGNVDGIQLLTAWFQTNGPSTATGNFGLWDGTLRTDIDITAAVAGYVFNPGIKDSFEIADTIGQGHTYRFVIGAAAAGTTTLYVVYRARLIR